MNLTEEEKSKVSVIPEKYKVSMELLDDDYIKQLYGLNNNTTTYSMGGNASQSEYNLAEELNGLNVEDQGSSNLC